MILKNSKIPLVRDTIDKKDIKELIKWLETNPRLTKGKLTIEFEKKWSKWLGVKYSVYLNSGSSANLAMVYAIILSKKLKNKKIIVPSVSWVTTVSPTIHLGLKPILCECDKDTLGIDIDNLEYLCKTEKPSSLIIVHSLAFPNKMDEIREICDKYDVILLEDSCESIGSEYKNKKTGLFGLMSSFSYYFGHHMSTIEGGMVSTNDEELYNILLSIRSHGWSRDLEEEEQKKLKEKYNISDFKSLYSFFVPGFNLRSTDLQAFLGIKQLDKIDKHNTIRNTNYKIYHNNIKNNYWKIKDYEYNYISNFAYPVITPNIDDIVKDLTDNGIETRPLICGNIGNQPFWIDIYGKKIFDFANQVDKYGLYLPNNHQITEDEILFICNIINKKLIIKK